MLCCRKTADEVFRARNSCKLLLQRVLAQVLSCSWGEHCQHFWCDVLQEGESADRFASLIAEDLPQVVVPRTYHELTSRRVLTAAWIDGIP